MHQTTQCQFRKWHRRWKCYQLYNYIVHGRFTWVMMTRESWGWKILSVFLVFFLLFCFRFKIFPSIDLDVKRFRPQLKRCLWVCLMVISKHFYWWTNSAKEWKYKNGNSVVKSIKIKSFENITYGSLDLQFMTPKKIWKKNVFFVKKSFFYNRTKSDNCANQPRIGSNHIISNIGFRW